MKLKEVLNLDYDKRENLLAVSTIVIYVAIVAIFFKIGGFMAELSTKQVPLVSLDGAIKLAAIAIMLVLVGSVFIFGPMMLTASTSKWTVS